LEGFSTFAKKIIMWYSIIFLIVGFVVLVKGADWLVEGGSALARKYHVSDLAIGLTVVAFGTSMPELVVNTFAAFQGHSGIVFGNIIGSNIFNIFVILGLTGIITPIIVQSSSVWREIPLSFLAIVILFVLTNELVFSETNVLSRIDGLILLGAFGGFLYYVFNQLSHDESIQPMAIKELSTIRIWIYLFAGLGLLILGGRLVVVNAVEMATLLGMSQTVIGLTIVAAGTSLPELATSVVAAVKKKNDIAVGNIIGSNIFNIFFILGVSALIRPIDYNPAFNQDIFLLGLGTLLLFVAMFSGKRKKLDRWEAAILLILYVAYTVNLIFKAS